MHKQFEPRFPECVECKFYRPSSGGYRCRRCGAGEFFEEQEKTLQLDDNELMKLFSEMEYEDD